MDVREKDKYDIKSKSNYVHSSSLSSTETVVITINGDVCQVLTELKNLLVFFLLEKHT